MKLLLCDDEPDLLTISTLSLRKFGGFEVVPVNSGKAALEAAAREPFDGILLDVMMPGMDGMKTFQALRELPNLSSVPVIFMTAKVQKSEIQRYLDLGARGVIHKPFDPIALGEQVKRLLGVT